MLVQLPGSGLPDTRRRMLFADSHSVMVEDDESEDAAAGDAGSWSSTAVAQNIVNAPLGTLTAQTAHGTSVVSRHSVALCSCSCVQADNYGEGANEGDSVGAQDNTYMYFRPTQPK